MQMLGDCWEGVSNHEWSIDAPTLEDLQRAVERLDAKTFTIVTIQGIDEQHLAVGGGRGRYVVYATFDNLDFHNLLSRQSGKEVVRLNAGGQEGEYPTKQVVDLATALSAARWFLLHMQLDPTLTWERQ